MLEQDVRITTKYGRMASFAACPEGPGKFPAIILYMDAPGFRDELKDMARRIANAGYFCLLPDLYYRLGHVRFDIARRDPLMSVVVGGAMRSITSAMVMDDTAGMIAFLDSQDKVKSGPLGCVGHCMSGPFVTHAAARFSKRMVAAASLYGVGMVTDKPDSPHLVLDQITGEMLFAFAEVDGSVPANVVPELTAAVEAAKIKAVVKTIPHTHHGYLFAARPDYSPNAAEEMWDELFEMWDRNLKPD